MSNSEKPDPKLKKGSSRRLRRRRSKNGLQKLFRLKFAGIAIAIMFVALVINRITKQAPPNPSDQTSAIVPLPEPLPSAPRPLPTWAKERSLSIPSRKPGEENTEIVYNIKMPPSFKQSKDLQAIVDDIVSIAEKNNLPKEPLSITLIDADNGEIAGYKQDEPRYPASVIKMFWMVELYAQIENGIWPDEDAFKTYISMMIKKSDNEAASFIVDEITNTQFHRELEPEELKVWVNKREQLNRFFQEAGYKGIDIKQKTFPIPYLKVEEPEGSDLQMRGDPKQPIRNKITTKQAARLIYEICGIGQAVSPEASEKMCDWLQRDLNPQIWKKQPPNPIEFNPVESFFGEALPSDAQLASKAGLTSGTRAEAAFVTAKDAQAAYILVIFADDPAYAADKKIFPEMSRLVYKRMSDRHK